MFASRANAGMTTYSVISVENQLEQCSLIAVIADAFAMCIVVECVIGV